MRAVGAAALAAALALAIPAARAQTVSGTAFEDRDGDGVRDPGEPSLAGVTVEILGVPDAGGGVDDTATTAADGTFSFAPGDGCYVLGVVDPAGWRLAPARFDLFAKTAPGYTQPVGQPRFGKLDHGLAHLKAGTLRYSSLGDSIAYDWNSCGSSAFWYSLQVRDRLRCAAPGAAIDLDQAAVKGQHTDDLLVDDNDDLNNVFRMIDAQPQLITISMIGNDLLGVDVDNPTQADTDKAAAEILDARQNLQEALSSLVAGIPGVDVTLNSLYDNKAYACYDPQDTSAFHRQWLPIVNRILRELAWGQARRVGINEVAADFAREDQQGACSGFDNQICQFLFDGIHPNGSGYSIVREKVWEAVGGANLGSRDALGRSSIGGVDYGFLRRVRRLLPTAWESRSGGSVTNPESALDDSDGGASASIRLGIGQEEVRFSGFPDWYDEVEIVKVIAGVRYRTSGVVTDDFYRIEASPTGVFRAPPGHAYSPTDWNYYTPIVGGGGPNAPASNPDYPTEKLLVTPNVTSEREVSATLTKNPTLPAGASEYEWPALTPDDLATTAIRVVAAPVAGTTGNDDFAVELDAAWLDLYGREKPRPGEVPDVRAGKLADGTLQVSFGQVPGAARYNLYFGRLDTLRGGGYDHGAGAPAGPDCDAPTADAGGGRLEISVAPSGQPAGSAYFLVTAHVDDVESPAGHRSDGVEIDRSQSICR